MDTSSNVIVSDKPNDMKKKIAYLIVSCILIVCAILIYSLFKPTSSSGASKSHDTYTKPSVIGNLKDRLINNTINDILDDKDEEEMAKKDKEVVNGKYIILERVNNIAGDNAVINIKLFVTRQVNGAIHAGRTVTSDSSNTAHPVTNCLRGSLDNSFAHTQTNNNYNHEIAKTQRIYKKAIALDNRGIYIAVALPSDQPIHTIQIYNRSDCCGDRAIGLRIRIVDSNGINQYIGPQITTNNLYYRYIPHLDQLTAGNDLPTLSGQCGRQHQNQICSGTQCCSSSGWCGDSSAHCNSGQSAFNSRGWNNHGAPL